MTAVMHSLKSFEKQMLTLDWNVSFLGETPVTDEFNIERDTTEKQQCFPVSRQPNYKLLEMKEEFSTWWRYLSIIENSHYSIILPPQLVPPAVKWAL